MLSAHYRSPINFSAELMEAAKNGLDRILTAVENINHLLESAEEKEFSADEQENMNKIIIPEIPEHLIDKINLILDDIDFQILHREKENRELASLRDFLLPLLMNGQVGFKE